MKENRIPKFFRNVGVVAAGNAVTKVFNVVNSIWMRRLLGPYNMGVWEVVMLSQTYMRMFNPGIEYGGSREIAVHRGAARSHQEADARSLMFSWVLLESIVSSLIFYLLILLNHKSWPQPVVMGLWVIGLVSIATRLMSCYMSAYYSSSIFAPVVKARALSGLLDVVLTLPLIWKFGLYGLFAGFTATSLVSLLYINYVRKKGEHFSLYWHLNWPESKNLLKVGSPVAVSNYFLTAYTTADSILVGRLLGITSLGLFGLATGMIDMLADLPVSILTVVVPHLMGEYGRTEDTRHVYKQAERVWQVCWWCIIPLLVVGVNTVIPPLLQRLLPKFLPAIPVMRILVFGMFFSNSIHFTINLLVMEKRGRQLISLSALGCLIMFLVCLGAFRIAKTIQAIAYGAVVGHFIVFTVNLFSIYVPAFSFKYTLKLFLRLMVAPLGTFAAVWVVHRNVFQWNEQILGWGISNMSLSLLLLAPLIGIGGFNTGLWHHLTIRFKSNVLKAAT